MSASGTRCSTPFGITEVGTRRRPVDHDHGHEVLNAFRHHRGGHPCRRRLVLMRELCAQRLSASPKWALGVLAGMPLPLITCSTPFGITELGTRKLAFEIVARRQSAQRLSASLRWALVQACSQRSSGRRCSTPFGITEVVTPSRPANETSAVACSTPFGITEVGTHDLVVGTDAASSVLNAFRHHRIGHTLPTLAVIVLEGAQRLSASPKWAPAAADQIPTVAPAVLNAFRHH